MTRGLLKGLRMRSNAEQEPFTSFVVNFTFAKAVSALKAQRKTGALPGDFQLKPGDFQL